MIRSGLRRVASKVKGRISRRLHPEPPPRVSKPTETSPAPAAPAPVAEVIAAPEPVESNDVAESGDSDLTREVVWELFEDMVRPALQADGGDIELIKVEYNDVYVRLMGACRSCPSSTITMKQGIERLLREEFPQFENLIQVDPGPGHEAAMAAAGQ